MTDPILIAGSYLSVALLAALIAVRGKRQLRVDNARLNADAHAGQRRLHEAVEARNAAEARVAELLAKPWVRCAYCKELRPVEENIELTPNVWACDGCTPDHCNACGGYECKECCGCIPACSHSKRTGTTCECTNPNPGAVVAAESKAP